MSPGLIGNELDFNLASFTAALLIIVVIVVTTSHGGSWSLGSTGVIVVTEVTRGRLVETSRRVSEFSHVGWIGISVC